MKNISAAFIVVMAVWARSAAAAAAPGTAAVPAVEPISLARIHADPPLAGRLPRAAKISPGGRCVSHLQPSSADSEVLELWVQPLPAGA